MLTLTYPTIDPVLVEIGPFAVRWYALSYIVGILLAWRYMIWVSRRSTSDITKEHIDDFVVWATLGIVLGGRLGYVIFYKPSYYLQNPIELLAVWQGGMSFHGGFLGVIFAVWLFCRRRGYSWIAVSDVIACAAPLGLFLGRIANFINGELYGRVTESPLGMVFPGGGPLPRHPSQLYEAALEGLVLFFVLFWLALRPVSFEKRGLLSGVFLAGYSIGRFTAEFFRQPDAHIGFLAFGTTTGQWLSTPLFIAGVILIYRSIRHEAA
ncbi:MAG: Prolipoprotein diacylglyceryl transferase [Alphaproteobacteria bacterium MarineAlpha11_Bin1]|nr:MAG: Prolipoprotein diacylglyceryl transferase [Alphaproteobacteria bacterium MarineAlpha11_Bin1]|tara:strand:- start:3160 stop:3957 length:798 start_codon:yes stop_codon:yes gene_type:complete